MPLYDFECDTCGRIESDQLVKSNKPYPCTKCRNSSEHDGMMQPKITAPSRTKSRWGDTFSNKI